MLKTLSSFTNAICAPMIVQRTSAGVGYIVADFVTGTATVEFKNGYKYEYTNVSRRAILHLLNSSVSMGFWVNNNLVNSTRVKVKPIAHNPHVAGLFYA